MLGDCKIDHWPVREDIHYRLRRSHVQRMICLPVPGTLRAAAPAAATAGYGPFVGKWRCIGQLRCCWSVLLPCHKSPRLKWQGPRVHLQDAMTTPSARRVDLYAVIMIIAAVFKASYSTSELCTTGRDRCIQVNINPQLSSPPAPGAQANKDNMTRIVKPRSRAMQPTDGPTLTLDLCRPPGPSLWSQSPVRAPIPGLQPRCCVVFWCIPSQPGRFKIKFAGPLAVWAIWKWSADFRQLKLGPRVARQWAIGGSRSESPSRIKTWMPTQKLSPNKYRDIRFFSSVWRIKFETRKNSERGPHFFCILDNSGKNNVDAFSGHFTPRI